MKKPVGAFDNTPQPNAPTTGALVPYLTPLTAAGPKGQPANAVQASVDVPVPLVNNAALYFKSLIAAGSPAALRYRPASGQPSNIGMASYTSKRENFSLGVGQTFYNGVVSIYSWPRTGNFLFTVAGGDVDVAGQGVTYVNATSGSYRTWSGFRATYLTSAVAGNASLTLGGNGTTAYGSPYYIGSAATRGGGYLFCRFGLLSPDTMYVGLFTPGPMLSSNGTYTNGLGFGFTLVGGSWQFSYANTGAMTDVSTGMTGTSSSTLEASMWWAPGSSVVYWLLVDVTNGTSVTGVTTVTTAANTVTMQPIIGAYTSTGTNLFDFHSIYGERDLVV